MKKTTLKLMLAATLLAAACGKKDGSLKIAGSDTMVQLGQNLARTYMEKNPGKSASVQGGGSGTGIAALLNGSADIASASREMKPKEWDLAKAKGIQVKEYIVALDALAVVVHPSNTVTKLTIAQLSDIYAGKINQLETGRWR
jgi:phosphate transport system substrate-binding protein